MEERVYELEDLEVQVQKVWEETRLLYEEELEISLLQRELEQAESWLSSYESSLLAEGLGVGFTHTARLKNCQSASTSASGLATEEEGAQAMMDSWKTSHH